MGVVLTPDLDQNGETIADFFIFSMDEVLRGAGMKLKKIFFVYTWLYRKIMRHRSFWSHAPVVGTVIRLAYFFWWVYILGWTLPPAFINGIVTVDIIHWILDFRAFRKIVS